MYYFHNITILLKFKRHCEMKKIIISTVLLGISLMQPSMANASTGASMEDALKDTSAGSFTSRFRGGYLAGVGFQSSAGGDGVTNIGGFLVELGVYGLFNPIKNFVDIEIGLTGKLNTGMSSTSRGTTGATEKTYYSGLTQVTIYGGPVFRFDDGKKGIGIGISKALHIEERQSNDMEKANIQKNNLENGLGVYIEYQTNELLGNITFIKLTAETVDIVNNANKNQDVLAGILIGLKF